MPNPTAAEVPTHALTERRRHGLSHVPSDLSSAGFLTVLLICPTEVYPMSYSWQYANPCRRMNSQTVP